MQEEVNGPCLKVDNRRKEEHKKIFEKPVIGKNKCHTTIILMNLIIVYKINQKPILIMQEKIQANKTLSKGNYQCALFASLSTTMISLDVFEIFPEIRCYYSNWFSFYFIQP